MIRNRNEPSLTISLGSRKTISVRFATLSLRVVAVEVAL